MSPETGNQGSGAADDREKRRKEREARRNGRGSKRASEPASGSAPAPPRRRTPSRRAPVAPEPARPQAAASGRRRAPAPRPSGGTGESRFGLRRALALVAAAAVVLLAWFVIALFQPFAGSGRGDGRLVVNIPEGASAGQVADILSEQGVVTNASLFELRLRLAGASSGILPGRYLMANGMSYGAAMDRLTGQSSDGLITLTVPEGLPRAEVGPIVESAGIDGDYEATTESFKGFEPARYGAKDPPNLEGFLFPATYELEPGSNVSDLVFEQLDAFEANIRDVDLSYAKSKNLNVYDVLKIASMIDREVSVPRERRLVAAVIYNRLSRGEPLGIDATTRYEYGNFSDPLTSAQLEKDTPYNTRLNAGLPPTPIGNPGLASIQAAARPAKVNYLFYVVDPEGCGEHSFTASAAEFEKLVAEYNAARERSGGKAPSDCGGGK